MDEQLVDDLIAFGMAFATDEDLAISRLRTLYTEADVEDAQVIYETLRRTCESLQDVTSPGLVKRRVLLLHLLKIPAPGQDQPPAIVDADLDNLTRLDEQLNALYQKYPEWPVWVQASGPWNYYVNNRTIRTILREAIPVNLTVTAKEAIVRGWGDHLDTIHLIQQMSQRFYLEPPYYPYDWARNIYYAMCYGVQPVTPTISALQVDLWNLLLAHMEPPDSSTVRRSRTP